LSICLIQPEIETCWEPHNQSAKHTTNEHVVLGATIFHLFFNRPSVIGGMLGATVIAPFFIPVFFKLIMKGVEKMPPQKKQCKSIKQGNSVTATLGNYFGLVIIYTHRMIVTPQSNIWLCMDVSVYYPGDCYDVYI
jgi:hypothetical protein